MDVQKMHELAPGSSFTYDNNLVNNHHQSHTEVTVQKRLIENSQFPFIFPSSESSQEQRKPSLQDSYQPPYHQQPLRFRSLPPGLSAGCCIVPVVLGPHAKANEMGAGEGAGGAQAIACTHALFEFHPISVLLADDDEDDNFPSYPTTTFRHRMPPLPSLPPSLLSNVRDGGVNHNGGGAVHYLHNGHGSSRPYPPPSSSSPTDRPPLHQETPLPTDRSSSEQQFPDTGLHSSTIIDPQLQHHQQQHYQPSHHTAPPLDYRSLQPPASASAAAASRHLPTNQQQPPGGPTLDNNSFTIPNSRPIIGNYSSPNSQPPQDLQQAYPIHGFGDVTLQSTSYDEPLPRHFQQQIQQFSQQHQHQQQQQQQQQQQNEFNYLYQQSQHALPQVYVPLPSLQSGIPASDKTEKTVKIRTKVGHVVPVKDVNGKFPCPECNRDYQHAKHLKRHMLRHSGDRPYSCILCGDTFSRSDILKRHFAKCSIRRGNPEGYSHLSHAHAHRRKGKAAEKSSPQATNDGDKDGNSTKSAENSAGRKNRRPCNMCIKLKLTCDMWEPCSRCRARGGKIDCTYTSLRYKSSREGSRDSSRQSSQQADTATMEQPPTGYGAGFNFPPPVHPNAHMTQHGHPSMAVPLRHPSMMGSTESPGSQSSQLYPSSLEDQGQWSPFINTQVIGLDDQFYGDNMEGESVMNEIYPQQNSQASWSQSIIEPGISPELWAEKRDQLLQYLKPPNTYDSHPEGWETVTRWLTTETIPHFVQSYFDNFHDHFPFIHLPTFNPQLAHLGLLSTMISVGAVYSDNGIQHEDVRIMLDFMYTGIFRHIRIGSESQKPPDLEDVQALTLSSITLTWHGNFYQRERTVKHWKYVVQLARQLQLFTSTGYSVFHQANISQKQLENWNWTSWVQQEKRNRCFYTIYLLDVAYQMYHNTPPQIKPSEIHLNLPADDAAWDAPTNSICARELGIARSPGGTQRSTKVMQPEFQTCFRTLMTFGRELPAGHTNSHSKFILSHALHAQIWAFHRWNLEGPHSQWRDFWVRPMDHPSVPDPYAMPDIAATMVKRNIESALAVLERTWHLDKEAGPPIGFSRDALPYLVVARRFVMANTREQFGFVPPITNRNVQVMIGEIRNASRILEASPIAAEVETGPISKIDGNYGVDELTYNMKHLFTPTDKKQVDRDSLSPRSQPRW